ncbi:MAG: helicase [Ancylobacter novellus]|uniref:Helicase n=1 Tax=Ancylobacter novellus TaxID=921 RepID=A0A2W5K9S4_ANCNO|nr:MAG: helicase [Ancylobacter novellus]
MADDAQSSVFRSDLPLGEKLERARTELLDLSARNRLLNVPRFSKSVRSIEIVDEMSAEIFRLLRDGKAFTFIPGRESPASGENGPEDEEHRVVELPQPDEDDSVDERGVATRHTDTRLQTRMTSKGLQKRLFDLFYDARTLEEEQGVNILFLALGMLKWIDPNNAANTRHAPLLLVPVALERGAAGEKFKLRARQEDVASNLSLEAYLDRVHALKLPVVDLGDDFDPAAYFAAVAEAVSTKDGWAVLADDIVLGFFSFAKFLMYRDLDPEVWPAADRISDRPLIRSLLADGFEATPELVPEDASLDDHLSPADMLHIVDSDSSQSIAVHEARAGRNLVIQGPPGTGKSQTIANVIAGAIADGKTVLFVAEKMAALDVVKRRLDSAGVGDACLELHSNKANKKQLLEELKRTWELGAPRSAPGGSVVDKLISARNFLNGHAARMHHGLSPSALTPYRIVGELIRLRAAGRRPVDFKLESPQSWTPDGRSERDSLIDELVQRIAEIGQPDRHPWRGVQLTLVVPTALERLIHRIGEQKSELERVSSMAHDAARKFERSPPQKLADVAPVADLARRIAGAPDLSSEALGADVWSTRAGDILQGVRDGAEHQALSELLAPELSEHAADAQIDDTPAAFNWLPETFDLAAFKRVRSLSDALPRIVDLAQRLRAELGSTLAIDTLAAVDRLVDTADRVAAAPAASPDAFAATVWDHGVERAGDVAQAVATYERVRSEIAERVTEAAWDTEVTAARQALAAHTGFFRRFNGDWRKADVLARSVLRNPETPLAERLEIFDRLTTGQKALKDIRADDGFGRSAFGDHWRGERTSSAPLLALVEWMRTLKGLGAEPRLIAGRIPERSDIGVRASELKAEIERARRDLSAFWNDLGISAGATFDHAPSGDRATLATLIDRLKMLADADERTRHALRSAPSSLGTRLELIDRIIQWQEKTRSLAEISPLGAAAFGEKWSGAASDWAALSSIATWVAANEDIRPLAARLGEERRSAVESAIAVERDAGASSAALQTLLADLEADARELFDVVSVAEAPMEAAAARLETWLANQEQLSKWVAYRDRAERARSLGLTELVDRLEDGRLAPAEAKSSFAMAYFEALLESAVSADQELGRFDGPLHASRALEFANLDRQRISTSNIDVVREHHRKIPPAGGGVGPLGVLRAEMARRRGHMPIRQLMQKAAPAVQALKPVLMMSPLSVAQFLPPGQLTFDLLVMDEASQIQPVDALGAIARCRQVVVVGDEKQLPPTRFFSKMTGGGDDDEDDGAQVADIESILGLFRARGLPQRMLRWHYRSRHQSLIAVSNSQFYENKLYIVPSPYTYEAGMGLRFNHVADGVFDSGGTGANAVEAKVVAEAILRHAKVHPELSLGVATFSIKQRRAIQDELEALRRLNPDLEPFFSAQPSEPFFVKNLENVQGDERDVILISVGYARNAQGQIAMRFGPLSAEGGERRLNVLISRAKRRCEVFASITDEDIDLERGKGKGVFAFKLFLHYARTGRITLAQSSGDSADSVFETQVAEALQAKGYQVHPRVGIAGLFVDLAIADPEKPGRYVLGVECDGPTYVSARSTRDRDRLRQSVLEDHGWIIHRLWSFDWLQRPQEQLDRLIAAIEAAKADLAERLETGAARKRAVEVEIVTVDRGDVTEIGLADVIEDGLSDRYYIEATPSAHLQYEMHETPVGLLAELVKEVVRVEGPVHLDEVVTRLRSAWMLQRAGARIQAAVERAVDVAERSGSISRDGEFLFVDGEPAKLRDRRNVMSATLRKPELLPPAELQAGIRQVINTNFGASQNEIVVTLSRLLGFKATSSQLRDVIDQEIAKLLVDGSVTQNGDLLVETPSNAVPTA